MADDTKACPLCGGTILAAAVKCKYCKSRIIKSSTDEIKRRSGPPAVQSLASDTAKGLCPHCGTQNTGSIQKCRVCGRRLHEGHSRMPIPALVAGGVLLLLAVVLVAVLTSRTRDQTRRAAEAARNEEQAREAAKVRAEAERIQRCKEIVASLQGQRLTANDESWLGPSGDLAKRIQTGTLIAQDLVTQTANLQCGEPLFNQLVRLVANSATLWAGVNSVDDVSQDLANALSGQSAVARLTEASREAFSVQLGRLIHQDLPKVHLAADCDRVTKLCQLFERLAETKPPACTKAVARQEQLSQRETLAKAKLKAREVARAAAAEAKDHQREAREQQQEERRERRCEGLKNRMDACLGRCILGNDADDTSCDDRCLNMLSGTGCD